MQRRTGGHEDEESLQSGCGVEGQRGGAGGGGAGRLPLGHRQHQDAELVETQPAAVPNPVPVQAAAQLWEEGKLIRGQAGFCVCLAFR